MKQITEPLSQAVDPQKGQNRRSKVLVTLINLQNGKTRSTKYKFSDRTLLWSQEPKNPVLHFIFHPSNEESALSSRPSVRCTRGAAVYLLQYPGVPALGQSAEQRLPHPSCIKRLRKYLSYHFRLSDTEIRKLAKHIDQLSLKITLK